MIELNKLRKGGIHINGKYTGIAIGFSLIIISILVFGNANQIISFEAIISFFAAVLTAGIVLSVHSIIKRKDQHNEQKN